MPEETLNHRKCNSSFMSIMSTGIQITWPCFPVGRSSHDLGNMNTKGNMNIKLWDLWDFDWLQFALSTVCTQYVLHSDSMTLTK